MELDAFKVAFIVLAVCISPISGQNVTSPSDIHDYATPKGCDAYYTVDLKGVALHCEVQVIDDGISLAVVPSKFTQALYFTCTTYWRSSFARLSFASLIELQEIVFEKCKFSYLPHSTFGPLNGTLHYLSIVGLYKKMDTQNDTSTPEFVIEQWAIGQLSNIRELNLAGNNIHSIPKGDLCQIENLQLVNLSNNYLDHIEFDEPCYNDNETAPQQLCGHQLYILDLSFNQFTRIKSNFLCKLISLGHLRLQSNEINLIDTNAFANLGKLTTLDLSANKISALPNFAFQNLTSLLELSLSHNNIKGLEKALFRLRNLQLLDLSYNKLEDINPSFIPGLNSLQTLILSHNNIVTISDYNFSSMPALAFLKLDHNMIQMATNVSFDGLVNLITLSLNDNNITTISYNVMECCPNLQHLSLANNNLTIMPNITSLSELITIDIGENSIEILVDNAFYGLENIQGIRLKGNKLSQLPDLVFKDLRNLAVLNLSENKLQSIPVKTLIMLNSLMHLNLSNNYITVWPTIQRNANLKQIDISHNLLTLLDYGSLPTGLTTLKANYNFISKIESILNNAKKIPLTKMDISHNQLTKLDYDSFPPTVVTVDLSYNKIRYMSMGSFLSTTALDEVNLEGNLLETLNVAALRTSVPVGNFRPRFYLSGNPLVCNCDLWWIHDNNVYDGYETVGIIKDLNYIYCWIPVIGAPDQRQLSLITKTTKDNMWCEFRNYTSHPSTCLIIPNMNDICNFACPSNCICYNSYSWSKTMALCRGPNVTSVPRGIPINVMKLFLDGSEIPSLNETSFEFYYILTELYLNGSHISSIDMNTFLKMATLEVLHLELNDLQELKSGTFDGLKSLRTLQLSSNKLKFLGDDVFLPLKSLTALSLHKNNLTTFPVWVLQSTPTLAQVTLSSNPWSCDCKYVDQYREWLQIFADKILDSEKLECRRPTTEEIDGPATMLPLIAFNSSHCMVADYLLVDTNLPIIVGVIMAFVTLIAASVLLFAFRHEMQVLIYSRYGVRLFRWSKEDAFADQDKPFDAFVAYSCEDEAFVVDELVPQLEGGETPFKLCLHQRNFLVGGLITHSILDAIECSRRTIVIMSDNFASSNWCRFEFKSAHLKMIEDRCQRLIMIVLGEVPANLDDEMKLYLKTNTYLKWGDKLFWQKLIYAMPDKHKHHESPKCDVIT